MGAIKDSEAAWFALPCAMIFISLATLCVMNMLIGVLCDVISEIARTEKEVNMFLDIREKMEGVILEFNSNIDALITFAEFQTIMSTPSVHKMLKEIGVEPNGFVDFGAVYFQEDDGKEVTMKFDELMNMVMDLREDKQATVKTLVGVYTKAKKKLLDNYDGIWEVQQDMKGARAEMDAKLDEINVSVGAVLGELQNIKKRNKPSDSPKASPKSSPKSSPQSRAQSRR